MASLPGSARKMKGHKKTKVQLVQELRQLRLQVERSERSANDAIGDMEERTAELSETNVRVKEQIAERKQAEKALLESKERFREMAENIAEVFWMLDERTGKVLYVSPAYEKIWGRSCESLYEQPRSYLDAIHPEDLKRVIAALDKLTITGSFEEEYRLVLPDGSVRWIWDRGFPVLDESGRPYHVVGITQDITDRKRAEEELRRSEEKHRVLLEINNAIIANLDRESLFKTIMQALVKVVQFDRACIVLPDPTGDVLRAYAVAGTSP
ncbi:MAG: PAS domain-containing protein, partial [Nitrospirales bacterium]